MPIEGALIADEAWILLAQRADAKAEVMVEADRAVVGLGREGRVGVRFQPRPREEPADACAPALRQDSNAFDQSCIRDSDLTECAPFLHRHMHAAAGEDGGYPRVISVEERHCDETPDVGLGKTAAAGLDEPHLASLRPRGAERKRMEWGLQVHAASPDRRRGRERSSRRRAGESRHFEVALT